MTRAVEVGSLGQLAESANQHHQALVGMVDEALVHILKAGEDLTEAFEQHKRGRGDGWKHWAKDNLEFGLTTADRYRFIFLNRKILKQTPLAGEFSPFSLEESIRKHLSVKRLKGDGAKRIEEAAEKQEITHNQAVELKQDLKERVEAVKDGKAIKKTEREAEKKLTDARLAAQKSEQELREDAANTAARQTLKLGKAWVDSLYYLMRHHAEDLDAAMAKNIQMTLVEARAVIDEAVQERRLISNSWEGDVEEVPCVIVA